eukprot:1513749-Pyramimonas_sp.AAC.1
MCTGGKTNGNYASKYENSTTTAPPELPHAVFQNLALAQDFFILNAEVALLYCTSLQCTAEPRLRHSGIRILLSGLPQDSFGKRAIAQNFLANH